LLVLLERRLDNVVYRAGMARSRAEARQLVRHGHFEVNGQKVDIPSYVVKPGDVVRVRESRRDRAVFDMIRQSGLLVQVPQWLDVDLENLSARVVAMPTRADIEAPLEDQLVVEFYSR
jgi:small subunit ribosomal protein S4